MIYGPHICVVSRRGVPQMISFYFFVTIQARHRYTIFCLFIDIFFVAKDPRLIDEMIQT